MSIKKDTDAWKIGFDNNFVAIGWAYLGDPVSLNIEDLVENMKTGLEAKPLGNGEYEVDYGEGPKVKKEKSFVNDAHAIRRFIDEVQKGDIMILPRYEEEYSDLWGYCIGRVTSDFSYHPENRQEDQEWYGTRWDVEWLKEVPKTQVSEKLRRSIDIPGTFHEIMRQEDEIETIIKDEKFGIK